MLDFLTALSPLLYVVLGAALTLGSNFALERFKERAKGPLAREAAYEAVRDALKKDILAIDGISEGGIVQMIEASYARTDALARMRIAGGPDSAAFVDAIKEAWTGKPEADPESILQKIHRHAAVGAALAKAMPGWVEKSAKDAESQASFQTEFDAEMARHEARREADRVAGNQSILDLGHSIEEVREAHLKALREVAEPVEEA